MKPRDMLHGFFLLMCLVQVGGWVMAFFGQHYVKFLFLTGSIVISYTIWVFVFWPDPDPPSGDDDARDASVR